MPLQTVWSNFVTMPLQPPQVASSPRSNARFHAWLILGLLALNLIMVFVAIHNLLESRQRTIEQVRTTTSNLAALLELNVGDAIRRIDLGLLSIVDEMEHMLAATHDGNGEVEALLNKHLERYRAVDAFRASNDRGKVLWGKGVDRRQPVSYADRPFFIAHQANPGQQLIISEPILGRVSKKWVIAFTRSYRHPDGSFAGIVTAAVTLDFFAQQLSKLSLGEHGSAVIRHQDTSLVTRFPEVPGAAGQPGHQQVSDEFRAVLDSGVDSGMFHTLKAPDGVERSYAFRRITQTPYILTVGMAPQDYLDDWWHEAQNSAFMLIAFFAVTLLGAWLLRRSWLRMENQKLFLNTLIENVPIPLFYKDTTGHYLGCNRAFEESLGKTRDQIIGKSVSDMAPPEIAQRYLEKDAELFAQPGHQSYEWLLSRQGEQHYVIFNKATFSRADGSIAGLIGTSTDITALKQVQSELQAHRDNLETLVAERTAQLAQARDAAEAASRAKSTFLANMSHELRTPMNGIMGMIDLVWRKISDPKMKDQLAKAKQSSEHLLSLINDILDISKIEAERLKLEKTQFRFGEILGNLNSLLGQKVSEKGLALYIDLAPQIANQALQGDPMRLSQILYNLTGNAIKFTEQGSISVRCMSLEDNPKDILLRCEVVDTGIGIQPDDAKRLFSAFEQADDSTTRKFGGTGLGLTISKRLAELMGGEMGVDSVPGAGSTFWFTARLNKSELRNTLGEPNTSAASGESRLRQKHAGTRVLLVEDDAINREVASDLLADAGLLVTPAEDGAIALDLAKTQRFDLILMDMQMPRLNGTDATRAIRADSLNMGTTILAMTANAFDEDRRACIAAGMNDHISKPFNPEHLFEVLLRWLDHPPA